MARRAAPTEIEVKFPGRDARHVAILLGALGVGPNRSGRSERVRDVYLDTEERAVLATGYGLRIRHRERGAAE
jgi:inorganic triphosphatase YgiF